MRNLVGRTLFSRVSKDATCKILEVSPGNKRVYFCEITEFGDTNYQAMSEMDIQKYYNEGNDQDLIEALWQQVMTMKPDRILLSEIRCAEDTILFLKTASDSHPGVITTLHAATYPSF